MMTLDPENPTVLLPVLVVGAGPVGLALACDLVRRGVRCRVIDCNDGPTPLHESRALVIWERTMEVFHDLDVADAVMARGKEVPRLNMFADGEKIAAIDIALDPAGTRYTLPVSLPQGETERILEERLVKLGGKVERQTRLIALEQDSDGVTATLAHGDYRVEELRTTWLVGCDGARSTVRKLLVMPFEGEEYDEHFLLADVRMTWDAPEDEAVVCLEPEGGGMAAFPLPESGLWRLIDATNRPEPAEVEDIRLRFRPLMEGTGHRGSPIGEIFWQSAFRIHRRIARKFRKGRCFLAGDAAHIHSPLGGQGMNTGIQDAGNLGWKLALAVKGRGSYILLDSYEAERRPIALNVLKGTHLATRGLMLRSHLSEAIRNRTIAFFAKREGFLGTLRLRLSEMDIAYPDSPAVGGSASAEAELAPGDRLPDVVIRETDGKKIRLFDLLNEETHHILVFTGISPAPAEIAAAQDVANSLSRRYGAMTTVRCVGGGDSPLPGKPAAERDSMWDLHQRLSIRFPSLLLVRPDRHIGYLKEGLDATGLMDHFDSLLDMTTGEGVWQYQK